MKKIFLILTISLIGCSSPESWFVEISGNTEGTTETVFEFSVDTNDEIEGYVFMKNILITGFGYIFLIVTSQLWIFPFLIILASMKNTYEGFCPGDEDHFYL